MADKRCLMLRSTDLEYEMQNPATYLGQEVDLLFGKIGIWNIMKLPSQNQTRKPLPLWHWANLQNAPLERMRWQYDSQGLILSCEWDVRK